MDESKLIEGCVRGEPWARKTVYELHAPAMMSVCQRYAGNRETARDLLHDGFVRLFTKIHTYSGTGSFAGWMRRIFVTTALEYLRRNDVMRYSAVIENYDCTDQKPDASVFEHLSADDLFDCIAALPDDCRTVFNLHAIEGYTHVEIAGESGLNENTVRARYARARQLLQNMVMKMVNSTHAASI